MQKFDLDFGYVDRTINPDPNRLPVEGNRHRLIRVAWDFFKLKGDSAEDLWQLQSSDDGEFLVRTFSVPDEDEHHVTASDWTIHSDAKGANLTIAYKNMPLHKIAVSEYGANTDEEVRLLQESLQSKLNTDENFVKSMLNELPPEKLAAIDPEKLPGGFGKDLGPIEPIVHPDPSEPELESPWSEEKEGSGEDLDKLLSRLNRDELEELNDKLDQMFDKNL